MEILWDKREIDRKCLNHARVHASAQSFDRCESQRSRFLVLTKRSAASGDENVQAPVVRKPINTNPRLNRRNPRSKFILRLNSVPRRPISTIQGLN